jgi:hypothetical protein
MSFRKAVYMKNKKSLTLSLLIVLSSLIICIVGIYWNSVYKLSDNPIAAAMIGIHDKVYLSTLKGQSASLSVSNLSDYPDEPVNAKIALGIYGGDTDGVSILENMAIDGEVGGYDFTEVDDSYFDDACFIGDSRTVGISKYAGIDNASFLCATSLTIFDYEKDKITYDGQKTSIRAVLEENNFGKIYLMFGINECSNSSAERYFEKYANTVNDIRLLQPGAIVFTQGSLFVTQASSDESDKITNDNIALRNYYVSLLENKQDIFYIDINESSLCTEGALVPDYTWDQVHIKAQYYPIWKDFLLSHGIVKS